MRAARPEPRNHPAGAGRAVLAALPTLQRFRGSALARLTPQPPEPIARRTRRSQPVGGRPEHTRMPPSSPLLRCGGFEARRWRASHLNHREPSLVVPGVASLSADDPSTPAGRAHRRSFAAGVSRLGAGAPHTSTTGTHRSPYPRSQPVSERPERTRRPRSLPCLRCGGFEARAWRPSHLNHRDPPRAVPGLASLSANEPTTGRAHQPAFAPAPALSRAPGRGRGRGHRGRGRRPPGRARG